MTNTESNPENTEIKAGPKAVLKKKKKLKTGAVKKVVGGIKTVGATGSNHNECFI